MAAKKSQKKSPSLTSSQKTAIGVGLTAAAVAAAGVYFLKGSVNADKNRAKIKSWMLKAKAEVLETLEKAEKMTETEYHELIDMVAAGYSTIQGATRNEVSDFRREMKDHWKKIEKSAVAKKATKVVKKAAVGAAAKAVKSAVKPTAKKAPKKAAKKAAKKTTKAAAKKK